jgi:Domain of unknown function (DUF4132)
MPCGGDKITPVKVRWRRKLLSVTDSAKEAEAIYDRIRTTSADRPFAFQSVEQMSRELASWQANNPALRQMRQATPSVLIAFVDRSVDWVIAESRDHSNFRVTSTLVEAILYALKEVPKPLPNEVVLKLLKQLRESAVTRFYYPFAAFLSILTRAGVTDEIRSELRRLHVQYAPSPTGKLDERSRRTRDRLAELMHVEGEKQIEPGQGPWSHIVLDEIAAKEDFPRARWKILFNHCRELEQGVPGAKWKKRSRELIQPLGESEVWANLRRWLALGPTPGQPPEARSPIEDSSYQKGVVWCLALSDRAEAAPAIGDFAIACLQKVPMLGAVSQKVGFACVQALGSMECKEAISQLARLRVKVKYTVALRLIEKCLKQAAERSGLTVDELEDFAVPSFALDVEGKAAMEIAEARADIHLSTEGHAAVIWRNAEGQVVKSAPSHIKKAFPKEVKSVAALAKEVEQAYSTQRSRLESSFLLVRAMPIAHWRQHFIEHPLLGLLGRKLIWVFSNEQGWEQSGVYCDGQICSPGGDALDLAPAAKVRLWHPLSSEISEVQPWRERIFRSAIRQPFRQAFREFYQITGEERQTKMYSNRFAGIVMRQHQFFSLCRAKGWNYRLMGAGFDGFNVPTKLLAAWNMHVEFYVDLPSDRDPALLKSALGEQSGSGINLFLSSDQVRFYRDRREIAVEDVPAIVYSEVMRDVDLFTSVSAVGRDESWSDQGDRGTGALSAQVDPEEVSAVLALRIEMLSRVLPLTPIATRCKIEKVWLEVRGQLGTYRILIPWGAVLRLTDSGVRHLNIPQKLLEKADVDFLAFPIELDYRTEMILRKAHVLANDWKIADPDLIRQLM